jgi:hypothetical protein
MPTSKPSWFSTLLPRLPEGPPAPEPISKPVSNPVSRPDRQGHPAARPAADVATNHDTFADRRRHRRAPLDVFANRFQHGYPYLCRVTDISRKGMRLYTFNEPQLPAANLSGLQFQLPGSSDVITASAEVVFENEASGVVGIRFLHLSKSADAAIDGYLGRTHAA